MLVYLSIYVAAVLEGEIYYFIQCSRAMKGDVFWLPVLVAGALGGATGDHFWFYLLYGRTNWVQRFPKIAAIQSRVSHHVHERETLILLATRFLPGLRTAIPATCAIAGVRPLKFSTLNLVSAFAWAGAIMLLARAGVTTLSAFGLNDWWGPLIPAGMLVLFVYWLSRPARVAEDL